MRGLEQSTDSVLSTGACHKADISDNMVQALSDQVRDYFSVLVALLAKQLYPPAPSVCCSPPLLT